MGPPWSSSATTMSWKRQPASQGGVSSLAAARPLHEPIARYGPFVMNTRAEIEQTLQELRTGHFLREEARDA